MEKKIHWYTGGISAPGEVARGSHLHEQYIKDTFILL